MPVIHRRDAVTLPRLSIATLIVVVARVALDIAVVRAFYGSRSFVPSPAWEALLLGVPLIGLVVQFGLFHLFRNRGRGRSFWAGFVVFGSVMMFIFIGTFVFFADSMDMIPCYWVAYYWELMGVLLDQLLPPHILARAPLVWDFGAAIMLFFPQGLIALTGGLLTRLIVEWSGTDDNGNGTPSPASLLPARIG
jgi:hypothetical protein